MSGLARSLVVLGIVSAIGTATQVAKGKMGAILFGPEGVGILTQLTSFYGLVMIIAGLGFHNGMTRRITLAKKSGQRDEIRSHINSVGLFLGAFSLILVVVCACFANPVSNFLFADKGRHADLVLLILAAVPFVTQQHVFRAYLNSHRNLRALARTQLVSDTSSVVVYAVLAFTLGLRGAVLAFALMHLFLCANRALYVARQGGFDLLERRVGLFNWTEIRLNIRYGINGLVRSLAASAAVLMIGRMIIVHEGLYENGIFAVAWKVSTLYLGAISASEGNYYYPTLVASEDNATLGQEMNNAISLYLITLPPCMAILILFGNWMIPLFFSSEFIAAVAVMAVLFIGDVFRISGEANGMALIARERLAVFTAATVVFYVGYVALSALFLPTYGIIAVALSYTAMQLVFMAITFTASHRILGVTIGTRESILMALSLLWLAPLVLATVTDVSLGQKILLALVMAVPWAIATIRAPVALNLLAKASEKIGLRR